MRIGLLLLGIGLVGAAVGGCNRGSDSGGKLSYREQAARAQTEKDPEYRAIKLTKIGYAQGKVKDLSGADDTLRLAREACEAIPDAATRSKAWVYLAKVHNVLENRSKAREATKLALASANEIESPERKAVALAEAAEAESRAVDQAAAKATLDRAEKLADSIGDSQGRIISLCAVAESYWRNSKPKEADRVISSALKYAGSIDNLKKRCPALAEIAVQQAKLKQKDSAAKTFDLSLESARLIEDQYAKSYAMGELAERLSASGFRAKAHKVLVEAESEAEKIPQSDLQRLGLEKIRSLMSKLPSP